MSARDARIYRVNAWREMKGREPLEFAEPEPEAPTVRPPEWWTEENTAAWTAQVWGSPGEQSATQGVWGHKIEQAVGRAGAACYTPLKPEVMAKWRLTDPRPSASTYYDGTPVVYREIAPKPKRARRAA